MSRELHTTVPDRLVFTTIDVMNSAMKNWRLIERVQDNGRCFVLNDCSLSDSYIPTEGTNECDITVTRYEFPNAKMAKEFIQFQAVKEGLQSFLHKWDGYG